MFAIWRYSCQLENVAKKQSDLEVARLEHGHSYDAFAWFHRPSKLTSSLNCDSTATVDVSLIYMHSYLCPVKRQRLATGAVCLRLQCGGR